MAISFDLLSILLIVILFQGAFVLSVLAVRQPLRAGQHLYLLLMVLCLMWFQAEFLSVRLPYDISLNLFYGTRHGAWFALGPLFYLYVRSIVGKSQRPGWVALVHFVPFFVFCIIIPFLTVDLLSYQQVHYGMLSIFYPFNEDVPLLQYVYSAIFVVQFVHAFIYLILAFRLTTEYAHDLKVNYSQINTNVIRWLKAVNLLLLATIGFVTTFLLVFFVIHSYNRTVDYLYVFPMAVLIYVISYKLAGVKWSLNETTAREVKYERSSLKADQAKIYLSQLEVHMNEGRPFLNNELRLQELADQLKIPSHHLSQIINSEIGMNFFDYVNQHRVEEAKRLIRTNRESSLLEIAFAAGFNNKTSFTNAFKKFTAQTPVEYKRQAEAKKS